MSLKNLLQPRKLLEKDRFIQGEDEIAAGQSKKKKEE
jgi:hypothetical protein